MGYDISIKYMYSYICMYREIYNKFKFLAAMQAAFNISTINYFNLKSPF